MQNKITEISRMCDITTAILFTVISKYWRSLVTFFTIWTPLINLFSNYIWLQKPFHRRTCIIQVRSLIYTSIWEYVFFSITNITNLEYLFQFFIQIMIQNLWFPLKTPYETNSSQQPFSLLPKIFQSTIWVINSW